MFHVSGISMYAELGNNQISATSRFILGGKRMNKNCPNFSLLSFVETVEEGIFPIWYNVIFRQRLSFVFWSEWHAEPSGYILLSRKSDHIN